MTELYTVELIDVPMPYETVQSKLHELKIGVCSMYGSSMACELKVPQVVCVPTEL